LVRGFSPLKLSNMLSTQKRAAAKCSSPMHVKD
jgi:hypothetical protein